MILNVAHTLLDDLPQRFQINIHILLHGRYELNNDLLDELSLNLVDLSFRVGLGKFGDSRLAHLDFVGELAGRRGNASLVLSKLGNFLRELLLAAFEGISKTQILLLHILRLLLHHGFQPVDLAE